MVMPCEQLTQLMNVGGSGEDDIVTVVESVLGLEKATKESSAAELQTVWLHA